MKQGRVVETMGSVGGVVIGTACCWLPLLLLAFGAGSAAASVTGFVARYHWVFVGVAVVLLGTTGWLIYLRKYPGDC